MVQKIPFICPPLQRRVQLLPPPGNTMPSISRARPAPVFHPPLQPRLLHLLGPVLLRLLTSWETLTRPLQHHAAAAAPHSHAGRGRTPSVSASLRHCQVSEGQRGRPAHRQSLPGSRKEAATLEPRGRGRPARRHARPRGRQTSRIRSFSTAPGSGQRARRPLPARRGCPSERTGLDRHSAAAAAAARTA